MFPLVVRLGLVRLGMVRSGKGLDFLPLLFRVRGYTGCRCKFGEVWCGKVRCGLVRYDVWTCIVMNYHNACSLFKCIFQNIGEAYEADRRCF